MSVQPARFTVERQPVSDGIVLRMAGELDIATVPEAEHALESALVERPKRLDVDLRPLTFVDSSGLRLFIVLAERARDEQWELKLIAPGEPAMTVFRLTGAVENLPFVEEPPGA